MVRDTELLPIPSRDPHSHKGTFGRTLIIAGSRDMTGAAFLATQATLFSGAGLATLAIPASILPVVSSLLTCSTFHPLPETSEGTLSFSGVDEIISLTKSFKSVLLGPGLSQHIETGKLVRHLVEKITVPVVLDADGLNAFTEHVDLLAERKTTLILTPHPGEMSRLTRISTQEIQNRREDAARGFTKNKPYILVLKGHQTLVTKDGRIYKNTTGNPGMATGGSGDVLAGMLAGLLAQRIEPYEATKLGVYIHGLAGDLACEELGEISMTANDILSKIPAAFQRYQIEQSAETF